MKTLFTALVSFALFVGAPASAWADFLRLPWKGYFEKSVPVSLDASTNDLKFVTNNGKNDTVTHVLLFRNGRVVLTVKNLPDGKSIVGIPTKPDGTAMGAPFEYKAEGEEEHAFRVPEDGHLRVYVTDPGTDPASLKREPDEKLELVVARGTALFGTLNAGAIYTARKRKTYSVVPAFDASGNPIPGRNTIVENRNDTSITSTVGGKMYYVFSEGQRHPLVRIIEEVGSFTLHEEGGTRVGLFLGIAGTGGEANNYQFGISFFTSREMNFAFSWGLNWAESERISSRFRPGDIVSFTDLSNITRRRWTPGFFFSITWNAPSVGK